MKNKIISLLLSVLATLLLLAGISGLVFLFKTYPIVSWSIATIVIMGMWIEAFYSTIKKILNNISNKDNEKQID